ncbi:hypothetical protein SLEP1_g56145, partial [Rubroshorea leprosula]
RQKTNNQWKATKM